MSKGIVAGKRRGTEWWYSLYGYYNPIPRQLIRFPLAVTTMHSISSGLRFFRFAVFTIVDRTLQSLHNIQYIILYNSANYAVCIREHTYTVCIRQYITRWLLHWYRDSEEYIVILLLLLLHRNNRNNNNNSRKLFPINQHRRRRRRRFARRGWFIHYNMYASSAQGLWSCSNGVHNGGASSLKRFCPLI